MCKKCWSTCLEHPTNKRGREVFEWKIGEWDRRKTTLDLESLILSGFGSVSPSFLFFCILKARPSSSSREWSQRSIFWTGLLLVCDCVCLCCRGKREQLQFQIIIPAGSTLGIHPPPFPPPPPPPRYSFGRSFTNMVPLALRLPMSIIHTACFSESYPKTGQSVQARDGCIHLLIVGNISKAISAGKWKGFPRHLFCLQNTQGLNQKKGSIGQSSGAARLSRG